MPKIPGRRRFLGLIAAGPLFAAVEAMAQSALQLVEPWQTVQLEHADRRARLIRLANLHGVDPPEFYEYEIPPSQHGLSDYPTEIPVLRVVFRDRVLFDFDRDDIKPEAGEILNLIAQSLRLEPPDVSVFVAGHTDAIGSVAYNLNLGLRRSKAVARALVLIGVNQAQLYAISFGKAVPVATNDTDDGRARNRRVEFIFAARTEAAAAWLAHQQAMSCSDKHLVHAQECPMNLTFTGVLVASASPPARLSLPSRPTAMNPTSPVSSMSPGGSPADIRIGDKVVDIDLRQKVFRIRAPE
ncbi:MAG: OmpA family protein [Proteobacteria bacterium]|nr:OmpA family protein [Pseudomonadota bacterium]